MKINYQLSCNLRQFIDNTKDKKILCFGGGSYFIVMCCDFSDAYPSAKIAGVIDNNAEKQGKTIIAADFKTQILSPHEAFSGFEASQTIILITTAQLSSVRQQLENVRELENADVYSYFDIKKNSVLLFNKIETYADKPLIPKIIHYCWFGENKMAERLQKCIDTWKRFCPDYEIKRWGENNYNVGKNSFLKRAYELKKWALISDYVRFDVVCCEGGFYFDTDVELLKSPDVFRRNIGFIGTEIIGAVNSGSGFGAVKNHPVLKEFKETLETQTNLSEYIKSTNIGKETEFFHQKGYKLSGKTQFINDMTIYPYYVLSHRAFETGETFTQDISVCVHRLYGSWRQQ